MITGVFGQKGSGKTTYVMQKIKKYQIILALCGSNELIRRGFRIFDGKHIFKRTLFHEFSDIYKIITQHHKLFRKHKTMIFFDDADFILSSRFDKELNSIFVFSRNYNFDIYYTCKRIKNLSSYVKFNTDMYVFFRYNAAFRDDISFLSKDLQEKILNLQKFQYIEIQV